MNHHHQIRLSQTSFDSKVKGFSLYIESEDALTAISELENALLKLKSGDDSFKEGGVMVGNVKVKYCYPYRPHCGAIGSCGDE